MSESVPFPRFLYRTVHFFSAAAAVPYVAYTLRSFLFSVGFVSAKSE